MGFEQAARSFSPSVEVVDRVAAIEGIDPVDLEVPLYDVVDPEALDRLVGGEGTRSEGTPSRIEFTYYGHRVVVTAEGTVDVSPGHED